MLDQTQPIATHAQPKQPPRKKRLATRVYAIITPLLLVALLAAILPACTAKLAKAPALAAIAAGGEATATPVPATSVVATATPLAVAPTPTLAITPTLAPATNQSVKPVDFEPAPVNAGGTCISGYTIDKYHKARGAGWQILFTAADGTVIPGVTADDNGKFISSTTLKAGKYTVELKVPAGWRPFTAARLDVTLDGISSPCAEVRFKVEALACLQISKVDDSGNLGSTTAKVGIPGWKMSIVSGDLSFSDVTNGKGLTTFRNLPPGTWTATEEDQVGWTPAKHQTDNRTIDLVSPLEPGDCVGITFTNKQVQDACIIVRKYDTSGHALPNWTIDIKRNDGTQRPLTSNTGPEGWTKFEHLAIGDWTVSEEIRPGWRVVGDSTRSVTLDQPSVDCDEITFTNEPTGCIDGYKINQLETGLGGWTITAKNKTTKEPISATTGADGYFRINNLILDTYLVSENPSQYPGWIPVTPSEIEVDVTSPDPCVHVRFKNKAPSACIDVYKTDAFDGAGLPNWPISYQPAYGGDAKWANTDGTGRTSFYNLTPGEYIVTEGSMTGWESVSPSAVKIKVEATGACGIVRFSNRQTNMPNNVSPAPTVDTSNPRVPNVCAVMYTVRRGDTLFQIGLNYRVTVAMIQAVNNLANPRLIYPGMVLCIPPDP